MPFQCSNMFVCASEVISACANEVWDLAPLSRRVRTADLTCSSEVIFACASETQAYITTVYSSCQSSESARP